MKERPIIFNDAMVRALLDGRKTQTRRIVKPQRHHYGHMLTADEVACEVVGRTCSARCPFGQPGDRLWVREHCWIYGRWTRNGLTKSGRQKWKFVASPDRLVRFDKPERSALKKAVPGYDGDFGWISRTSIHMPRLASRITLEITAVRVERLQDISRSDCMAEGLHTIEYKGESYGFDGGNKTGYGSPTGAFSALWQSIHGAESWQSNPWVWAIEFKRVTP